MNIYLLGFLLFILIVLFVYKKRMISAKHLVPAVGEIDKLKLCFMKSFTQRKELPINRNKSLPHFTARGRDLQVEPLQQAHKTGVQAVPSERQAA